MGRVKFSSGSFIGKTELQKLVNSLDIDGFRKFALNNTAKFGLINNNIDASFDNGKISLGTNALTIKHSDLLAINVNGQFIIKSATDNISVPNDGNFYWIKIKYQESSEEVGTYSIDSSGNLTGVGTSMLEFRGQPNLPTRIKFTNASLNTLEYDVLEVLSNTSAVLQGEFSSESDLKVSVIGTFTPGMVPSSDDKNIFQYDSCILSLIAETTLNTRPVAIENEEFFLARVKVISGQVVIEDKRTEIWQTRSEYFVSNIDKVANPLAGVEKIVFDHIASTRDKNIVYAAWAFRTTNWTIDSNLNKIAISAGSGGRYKSTADFINGNFDGWRVYTKDGSFSRITSSVKSFSQINLILDIIDVDKYSDPSQELIICPDVEEIEFVCTPNVSDNIELPALKQTFLINEGFGKIYLLAYKDPTCLYNIKYRYKNNNEYSNLFSLISDSVGYYTEDSFNSDGSLKDISERVLYPYISSETDGYIQLTISATAYSKFKTKVDSGDVFGVQTRQLSNDNPVVQVFVGTTPQYQLIDGSITFTADHYINLNTLGAINGNSFILDFRNAINSGSFFLRIVQGYVNSGNTGSTLITFDSFFIAQAQAGNLLIKCVYDGTNWKLFPHVSIKLIDLDKKVDKYIPSSNANDFTVAGFTFWDGSTPNAPDTGQYHVVSSFLTPDYGFQLARKIGSGDNLFHRLKNAVLGGWTSWIQILDSDDYNVLNEAILLKADIIQPAWISATVGGTFTGTAKYRKEQSGKITLQGNVSYTNSGSAVAFTLPVGHRPLSNTYFVTYDFVNSLPQAVVVGSNGDVTLILSGSVTSESSDLSSISFWID